MQGKKLTIKRMIKKIPLECKTVFVIIFIYLCLHFTYIKYRDTIIIGFSTSLAPSTFFSNHQRGILLGWAELKTQFGTIKVKPFCSFSAYSHDFKLIEGQNFKTGRATHDFSILGNEIDNPYVSFGAHGEDVWGFAISQTLNIRGYDFGATHIHVRYNERTNSYDLEFTMETNPVRIALSDGTQIEFRRAKQEAWLRVQTDNMWKLEVETIGDYYSDYFSVTPKGSGEPGKYTEITFEENWGAFKDGTKYIEVKRRTYP